MPYTIRDYAAEGKFSQHVSLGAVQSILPASTIVGALAASGRQTRRERKLNLVVTVWVVIGLFLFARSSVPRVLAQLAQGVRLLWGDGEYALPGASALSYRRDQLGVRPLALLCRTVCRPLATPDTPRAFAFGRRLVALDGTVDAVADTPANAKTFGRALNGYSPSAYPQVRGVHLVECGTHALLGCTFWPFRVGERRGAFRLLPQVPDDSLLLWDAGFHDFDLLAQAQARHLQVLARLPGHVQPQCTRDLGDGSFLARLQPSEPARRKAGEQILVRWIEYRITDPAWPGHGRTISLITTLLDPVHYPVREVIAAYHARWDFEEALDEIETHQRLAEDVLRGRHPRRIMQELYGLVLAHYLLRALMQAAALRTVCAPTDLSFTATLIFMRQAVLEFQLVSPGQWPALFERLLRDIGHQRLPPRPLRTAPRVVKRRLSKFPRKRDSHRHLPQPTKPFVDSIVLI